MRNKIPKAGSDSSGTVYAVRLRLEVQCRSSRAEPKKKKCSLSTEIEPELSLLVLCAFFDHSPRCCCQWVRALRITVFEGRSWSRRGFAFPAVTPSPKGTPMILWICMNKLLLKSHFGTVLPLTVNPLTGILWTFYTRLLHSFNIFSRWQEIVPLMQLVRAQDPTWFFQKVCSSTHFPLSWRV